MLTSARNFASARHWFQRSAELVSQGYPELAQERAKWACEDIRHALRLWNENLVRDWQWPVEAILGRSTGHHLPE